MVFEKNGLKSNWKTATGFLNAVMSCMVYYVKMCYTGGSRYLMKMKMCVELDQYISYFVE